MKRFVESSGGDATMSRSAYHCLASALKPLIREDSSLTKRVENPMSLFYFGPVYPDAVSTATTQEVPTSLNLDFEAYNLRSYEKNCSST